MRKKAVIFDMDGLMFDTETLGYQAQGELAEELGFADSVRLRLLPEASRAVR